MSDLDRLTESEQRLRARLQRTLEPPPTPLRLAAHVDELAAVALEPGTGRARRVGRALGAGRTTLRLVLAAAAVVAMLAVAGLLAGLRPEGEAAATPHPTLPAVSGPALPSPAASPTVVVDGAWIDASSAWLVDDSNRLRMTVDGGQTWSEPRDLPSPTDLGLAFLDAQHGYTTWARETDAGAELVAYRTADGGMTWDEVRVGVVPHLAAETVLATGHFSDRSRGVVLAAVVVDGEVAFKRCTGFWTDDGGDTWAPVSDAPCFTTVWWDPTGEVAVALPTPGAAAVVSTTDGGRAWRMGTLPGVGDGTEFWTQALVAGDGSTVHLLGAYHRTRGREGIQPLVVLESVDGGLTWEETVRTRLSETGTAQSMWTFDSDHWLAVMDEPIEERPFRATELLETWDGGRTWAPAGRTGTISASRATWADRLHGMLQGVDMGDCSDPSLPCGGVGTLFLTNDGGRSWHEVPF